jgi:hypothetical protein
LESGTVPPGFKFTFCVVAVPVHVALFAKNEYVSVPPAGAETSGVTTAVALADPG